MSWTGPSAWTLGLQLVGLRGGVVELLSSDLHLTGVSRSLETSLEGLNPGPPPPPSGWSSLFPELLKIQEVTTMNSHHEG